MPEDITDVKETTEGSSPDVAATGASEEVVKETESSTSSETSADPAKGFADAMKAAVEKALPKESTEKEEKVEAEAETTSEEEEEKETTEEPKKEDKGPVPYDRFVEVNTAKQQLEQRLKEAEPFIAAQRNLGKFFVENNLANEEIDFWLNVAASYKNNPEEALKMLQPHIKQLQEFQGEVLPSEFQKAVDDGEMSLAWAKKLAAAENKTKFSTQQTALTKEQIQQRETERFVHEAQTGIHNWVKTKMGIDPDYKPKAEGARNGKFEFVQAMIKAGYQEAGIKTVADMVNFAEECYKTVTEDFKAMSPPKSGTKVVKSNNSISSNGNGGPPKSFEEAMQRGAKKAGVNFNIARK